MRTVLLIDGDPIVRRILAFYLGSEWQLLHAANGNEGRVKLAANAVDVVVMEYRLPDVSGLEFLSEIKTERPSLPVVMVTGCGSEVVCTRAWKMGVNDYFAKPVDPVALVRAIQETFSRESGSREPGGDPLSPIQPPVATSFRQGGVSDLSLRILGTARFVEAHYWDKISLPTVARLAALSQFTFSRAFKGVMGVSFRRYVAELRIRKAQALLEGREYSVTEIAHMVGFGDLPRFDKVFKRCIGTSPSAYRSWLHRQRETDRGWEREKSHTTKPVGTDATGDSGVGMNQRSGGQWCHGGRKVDPRPRAEGKCARRPL